MKIYTKVVINMATEEVIEEEFFDYEGSIALCGSSGSSGGSSAGEQDWPSYMKTMHRALLFDGEYWSGLLDSYTVEADEKLSVLWDMREARGDNPFTAAFSYNPTTDISTAVAKWDELEAAVTALPAATDWVTVAGIVTAYIDASILDTSHYTSLSTMYQQIVDPAEALALARFQAQLADVGAVMNTSFTVGTAVLTAEFSQRLDRFATEIVQGLANTRISLIAQSIAALINAKLMGINAETVSTSTLGELMRVKIVANKEYLKEELSIAAEDGLWNLKLYPFGTNVLAGIAGAVSQGTPGGSKSEMSSAQSVLGGVLSVAGIIASFAAPAVSGTVLSEFGATSGTVLSSFSAS